MRDQDDRYLVLVTGFAAAGKSTLAPRIANELGALWTAATASRDGLLRVGTAAPRTLPGHPRPPRRRLDILRGPGGVEHLSLDAATRHPKAAVVEDTPFNPGWNRAMFNDAAASITVPMVEVALHGEPVSSLTGPAVGRPVGRSTRSKPSSASIPTGTTPASTSQFFPSTGWSTSTPPTSATRIQRRSRMRSESAFTRPVSPLASRPSPRNDRFR